jgi:hypothetical protein
VSTSPDPNPVPDADSPMWRTIARTVLLALSLVLLFPRLLGGIAGGAWPRLVDRMGTWKWVLWGASFAGMIVLRFAGGPKRRR